MRTVSKAHPIVGALDSPHEKRGYRKARSVMEFFGQKQ